MKWLISTLLDPLVWNLSVTKLGWLHTKNNHNLKINIYTPWQSAHLDLSFTLVFMATGRIIRLTAGWVLCRHEASKCENCKYDCIDDEMHGTGKMGRGESKGFEQWFIIATIEISEQRAIILLSTLPPISHQPICVQMIQLATESDDTYGHCVESLIGCWVPV